MRKALLAVLALATLANPAWSQRGIRISFPRPTVAPHIMPHGPHMGHSNSSSDSSDVVWIIVGSLAAIGLLVGAIFGVRALVRKANPVMIRIVAAPPGEAPEEIRSEWIGLELPLLPGEPLPITTQTVGVLTDRPTGVATGFVVDGAKAIEMLAARSPTAAEWWREAAPHIMAPGYKLSFPPEVCEKVT